MVKRDADSVEELYDSEHALTLDEIDDKYTNANEIARRIDEKFGQPKQPVLDERFRGIYPSSMIGKPFDGTIPEDIHKMSFDQISMMLTLSTQYYQFVMHRYSNETMMKKEIKKKRDVAEARMRNLHKQRGSDLGIALTNPESNDITAYDSRFVERDADYVAQEQTVDYFEQNVVEKAKSLKALISRQVSVMDTKINGDARARGIESQERYAPSRFANRGVVNVKQDRT